MYHCRALVEAQDEAGDPGLICTAPTDVAHCIRTCFWLGLTRCFAVQILNTAFFLVGYLGFLSTWIMDTIYTFVHKCVCFQVCKVLSSLCQEDERRKCHYHVPPAPSLKAVYMHGAVTSLAGGTSTFRLCYARSRRIIALPAACTTSLRCARTARTPCPPTQNMIASSAVVMWAMKLLKNGSVCDCWAPLSWLMTTHHP